MAAIEAEKLNFTYPDADRAALSDVTFSIPSGGFYLLMGPSGSGKSTLLRLLQGEIAPHGALRGRLHCDSPAGFVFQNPQDSLVTDSVQRELAFSPEHAGLDGAAVARRVGECAAFFHLEPLMERTTASLSGGEQQLLSLAAAMTGSPRVLLLDEPCAALDPAAEEKFLQVLLRLNRELGVTVLMSTHTPGAALAQADGVLLLRAGRCTCYDDPHAFARALRQSGDPMLQALPVGAILFDEVPLTVREAQPLAAHLRCKPAPAPQPAGKSVLTLKEICFAYEKKGADVLFRLSLTLTAGKCYGIVGANGSGKSTLLGVMAGVLKPYAGKVQRPVPTALLPQTVQYLFTRDRVDQLVQAETLQHLGIAHLAARHPLDLSGGESRLVGLGMVLDTGADTLLLDEPTAGLDAGAKAQLGDRLRHLCAAGKTVVLVTHDLDFAGTYSDEAAFLCNRVVTPPRPRRAFFAGMELYTTGVRRVTCRALPDAVSPEDLVL